MTSIPTLALVASLLISSAPSHATPVDALTQCAARLAVEVFGNAKARGVPKTDQLFQGIAAYIRVICIEQEKLAEGLDKAAADERLARGMNYANRLIYYPQLHLAE